MTNSKIRAPFAWFGGKGSPRIKKALIETLLRYRGAVVLSGYDNALYAPLAAAGWDKAELEVCCCAAGRTRHSGLQGAGKVKEKQRRVECIWRNPEAMRRIKEKQKKDDV